MAGGVVVSGVVETLNILIPVITEQIGLAWGAKDELEKLKKTLERIMAVVTDAEQRQVKEEQVKLWLETLKGLAYDVNDILDDYSYKYMRKRELENRKRDLVRYYVLPSTYHPFVFPIKIGNKIKKVNTEFHKIMLQKDQFHLQPNVCPSNRMGDVDESNRKTYAYVGDLENIVGRETDKCYILKMLLTTDSHSQIQEIPVIPIVGMGGAGKTTLARLVYNDESVEGHFESRIWVYVSNDFDIEKLLKDIIESIKETKCDELSSMDVLIKQLHENLSDKRYLLVLDDLWNKNVEWWASLKVLLEVGAPGSKILVTTRNEDVAKIVAGEYPIHSVEVLKEEECWSIFQKFAFGAGGAAETPTLRAIGKEMVKKCGGLPLAAKTLGSLMHSKKEEHEWKFMRDNEIRNIPEDESRIIPILKLSYNHLPSHLKQCFSYCAIFPKNQRIERKTLIQLWMAEGFIQQYNENDKLLIEDIGNDYFRSLLRSSLFQNVEKDKFEEVTTCKMHNLVHELAQNVAGTHECLIVDASEVGDISQVRRLHLLNFDESMSPRVSKALKKAKKLRTLFLNSNKSNPMPKNNIEELFKNNRLLRVLDLSGTNMEELPSSIGKLKHLRYLDLSYTNIKELPDSISELYSLQTLKLRKSVGFIRLPKDTYKLINLRHLIHFGIIPRHLGHLTCLQTIQEFRVCDENEDARGGDGYGLEELGSLNSLGGDLTIHGLENFQGNVAWRANLKGKSNLCSLSFEWGPHLESSDGEQENEEMVLEGLQPHPDLKSLCIDGFGGAKLPAWMGLSSCLPNLVELTLRFIHGVEQLPSLGGLPLLKILVIEGMTVTDIGKGYSGNATNRAFPALKELTLKSMIYLEAFSSFPHLEKLEICECPCLKVAPTFFPLLKELLLQGIKEDVIVSSMVTRNIMSLTKIEISEVAKLKYLPQELLQNNSTLKSLEIDSCPIFKGFICEVPSASGASLGSSSSSSRSNNSSLETLELRRCPVLMFLPDLRCFTSLRILKIFDCKELIQSLPVDDLKKSIPSLELLCVDDMWMSWSTKYEGVQHSFNAL